jgi:chromosome segregation ATPase
MTMPVEAGAIQVISGALSALTLFCSTIKPLAALRAQIQTKQIELKAKQIDVQAHQDQAENQGWQQLVAQLRADINDDRARASETLSALEIRLRLQINEQSAKIARQQGMLTSCCEDNEGLHKMILQMQDEAIKFKTEMAEITENLDATSAQLAHSQDQIHELQHEVEVLCAERDDLKATVAALTQQMIEHNILPVRQPLARDSSGRFTK